jgi:hypothetical protein
VSHLFPDRVLIGLSPAALSFARLEGGPRPKIADKGVLECDPPPGPEPWQGATAALAERAAALKDRRADVTVVLSNHFVRYASVPWSEGLERGTEDLAFARYCFAKIHGDRSKDWEIRLSDGFAGSARVASAIDAALLRAIQACFPAGSKARLVSVQPYLMSAFNKWRPLVKNDPTWLLLVESNRACLAHLENGRWTTVRNARGNFEGPEQWADLLERERHLVPVAGWAGRVLVHAPHRGKTEDMQEGIWRFESLGLGAPEGFAPLDDAQLAMALCAQ